MSIRETVIYSALAASLVAGLYGRTLWYGFDWDDYHLIRHYSRADVAKSFYQNWDPSGIERPYYRPFTITFFAVGFRVLGTKAEAWHAVSLVLTGLTGLALAWWLRALGQSAFGACAGLVMFLANPFLGTSAVTWITNLPHILQLDLAIGALWLATLGSRHWPFIVAAQVAAMLLKEDGIMLGPAVLALWWIRAEPVSRRWLASSAASLGIYALIRGMALDATFPLNASGLLAAPLSLVPLASGPFGAAAGVIAAATLGVAWVAGGGRRLRLPLLLAVIFDVPLLFAQTTPNHWHLVVLAVAVTSAVALDSFNERLPRPTRWILLTLLGGLLSLAGWTMTSAAAPCSAIRRDHSAEVQNWGPVVEPEMRTLLNQQIAQCQ